MLLALGSFAQAQTIRYVDDGGLSIDNNPAENALRGIVVGRKNWLFAGSDRGGRTGAVLSSFVASCKRHSIDPFACLRDVLARISATPVNELAQFLPDRWVDAVAASAWRSRRARPWATTGTAVGRMPGLIPVHSPGFA